MTEEMTLLAEGGVILLGCGKMGGAMLDGWLAAGLPPSSVTVIDPGVGDYLRALQEKGVSLNPQMLRGAAVCVLAVKPQMMAAALPQVARLAGEGTLFLSIAAGLPIKFFEDALGPRTIVIRAMPNTPAAVGRGITALIGNKAVDDMGMRLAEALASAVGECVRLDDESQMDAVTGVSGSGPAYVFNMIEALAAAGEAEGLPPELAMTLARATVSGAGELAARAGESAAQLRINVTSPGGTTAAALGVLMDEDAGLAPLMRKAVAAAATRSRELAG
ncbi:MAG: pyrroline-5-carboxylate reductase [Paracoccaceae bacterium]|jgi:pyrroline-5-carboxylate reductase